jgi:hypothetical protein
MKHINYINAAACFGLIEDPSHPYSATPINETRRFLELITYFDQNKTNK